MAAKYTKKITVSLTEDDYNQLNEAADKDRRTIGQYASMLVEDVLELERKGSTPAQIAQVDAA